MKDHTPTPWKVGVGPNKEIEIFGPMRMNAHPILASLEHDPRDANAAFIIRAVNCHDELVNTLDESLDWLKACLETVEYGDPPDWHEVRAHMKTIDSVLAKARKA